MANYLVTGCAGFIGSHLVELLLGRGDSVIGIDSFNEYYDPRLKRKNLASVTGEFQLIEGDIAGTGLDRLLEGVDGIFHLAGQPGVRASWGASIDSYLHNNILVSQSLFKKAADRGLRVVWASSSSIYGNAAQYPTAEDVQPRPVSPYGVTKLACEHLAAAHAESFGLDHVALRFFTVYGPRQRPDMAITRIIRTALESGVFSLFGTGDQSRDVTYVGDAVSAAAAAMERGASGASYNVGGGSETSLNEIIGLCDRLMQDRVRVVREPVQQGDVRRTSADTTRIRQDTGWMPATELQEGLAWQIEWASK